MKTTRVLLALAAIAFALPLAAQETNRVRGKLQSRLPVTPKGEPTIDGDSRTGGVISRTIRADNPLQLINPWAPPRYGTGEKMTGTTSSQGTQTSGEEERPKTLKLFAYEF